VTSTEKKETPNGENENVKHDVNMSDSHSKDELMRASSDRTDVNVTTSSDSMHPPVNQADNQFVVVWNGSMLDALGTRGGLLPQRDRRTVAVAWRQDRGVDQ